MLIRGDIVRLEIYHPGYSWLGDLWLLLLGPLMMQYSGEELV
jgi:hypothetical protein